MTGYRKALVALLSLAANAVAQGLVVGTAAKWVSLVLGAATVAGVWAAPNTPTKKDGGHVDAAVALALVALFVAVLVLFGARATR